MGRGWHADTMCEMMGLFAIQLISGVKGILMPRMRRVCVGGLVALVILATGASAIGQERFGRRSLPNSTGRDYVCEVFLIPPGAFSPGNGTFGSVRVLFYTAPNCTGELIGDAEVFSQGATDENSSPSFLVTEATLHTYFAMLQRSVVSSQRVIWVRCEDTKRNCIKALGVRAGPPQ